MKCKAFFLSLATLFFMSASIHVVQAADADPDPIVDLKSLETKADFEQAYEILKDRVDQLQRDKKEAVTKKEKELVKVQIKETKKEIKALKAKALSGGVYIGSGVLVLLIILLLIL